MRESAAIAAAGAAAAAPPPRDAEELLDPRIEEAIAHMSEDGISSEEFERRLRILERVQQQIATEKKSISAVASRANRREEDPDLLMALRASEETAAAEKQSRRIPAAAPRLSCDRLLGMVALSVIMGLGVCLHSFFSQNT